VATSYAIKCPLCRGVLAQADAAATGRIAFKCHSRKCARPVVTFDLGAGRAVMVAMVDRRERRRVVSS